MSFIRKFLFFQEEMNNAKKYGRFSVLTGRFDRFCEEVIKKSTVVWGPTAAAAKETKLEQLCGDTGSGKYFFVKEIVDHPLEDVYLIELRLHTDGLPVAYQIKIKKDIFDKYVDNILMYVAEKGEK